jgi:hypothetical protein
VSPEELRCRARQKRAEAADLTSDADRLRGHAAALRGMLDPLVSMSHRVWVGPAAEDFEGDLRRHGGMVDGQANRLSAIAGGFDSRAAEARRVAAGLDARATAAESAASTGVTVGGVA